MCGHVNAPLPRWQKSHRPLSARYPPDCAQPIRQMENAEELSGLLRQYRALLIKQDGARARGALVNSNNGAKIWHDLALLLWVGLCLGGGAAADLLLEPFRIFRRDAVADHLVMEMPD